MHKKINKQKGSVSRRQANASRGGYTIIETMIAIALFLVIVMSGMGSLLNASLLHKKSQSMRSIMDNLSFIMEDMSRNLRTGYNYHCITGAENLATIGTALSGQICWGIAFEYQNGSTSNPNDQWVYEIVTPNSGLTYYIRRSVDSGVTWVQLTPDEVVIDPALSGFSVLGAEPPNPLPPPAPALNQQQPFVIIRLSGKITSKEGVVTPFSLQTSVSQRLIDIKN